MTRFVAYYHFIDWWQWSLGIHVDLSQPHFEIHVPFGFIRFGWLGPITTDITRTFGYDGRWYWAKRWQPWRVMDEEE